VKNPNQARRWLYWFHVAELAEAKARTVRVQGMELAVGRSYESVVSGPMSSMAANRRVPELLKSKHRAKSKFDGSAILFDRIVQIFR